MMPFLVPSFVVKWASSWKGAFFLTGSTTKTKGLSFHTGQKKNRGFSSIIQEKRITQKRITQKIITQKRVTQKRVVHRIFDLQSWWYWMGKERDWEQRLSLAHPWQALGNASHKDQEAPESHGVSLCRLIAIVYLQFTTGWSKEQSICEQRPSLAHPWQALGNVSHKDQDAPESHGVSLCRLVVIVYH